MPSADFENNEILLPVPNMQITQEETEDESVGSDINQYTKYSEQYRNINVGTDETFIDPATGQIIDKDTLTHLEKIKVKAKSMNISLNDPDPSCKKCYGRGYIGVHVDDNSPIPCQCLYKEYYKNNPEAKKNKEQFTPKLNRKQKRAYEKSYRKYLNKVADMLKKQQAIIDNSKANLGKITPVKPKVQEVVENATEDVVEETVE